MEKEDLEKLVFKILEGYKDIHDETHSAHHAFIEMMIKKEERRQERMEKIKAQVGGWGVILLLGFIGKTVWEFVVGHIK